MKRILVSRSKRHSLALAGSLFVIAALVMVACQPAGVPLTEPTISSAGNSAATSAATLLSGPAATTAAAAVGTGAAAVGTGAVNAATAIATSVSTPAAALGITPFVVETATSGVGSNLVQQTTQASGGSAGGAASTATTSSSGGSSSSGATPLTAATPIPVTGGTPTVPATMSPAASSPTTSALSATGAATVNASQVSSLGMILVDSSGKTLYEFAKDTPYVSNCLGSCRSTWPPLLTTGAPVAGANVDGTKLSTITTPDNQRQVTYNGHPLYTFSGDTAPGDANGQNFKQQWQVVNP